jgi:hypothetical protein
MGNCYDHYDNVQLMKRNECFYIANISIPKMRAALTPLGKTTNKNNDCAEDVTIYKFHTVGNFYYTDFQLHVF